MAEAPNITDQELQLVAETTEATNNILDDTIEKMIRELDDKILDNISIQQVSAANNEDVPNVEDRETRQNLVLNNALSSIKRLQEIEDIRAIFQILGIGS